MSSPNCRHLLAAGLALLSAGHLKALDLRIVAEISTGGEPEVFGTVTGFDEEELIALLDGGNTLRMTWLFRLGTTEEVVLRYARRDPLRKGYFVYDGDWNILSGPIDHRALPRRIRVLPRHRLEALGSWNPKIDLESRFFIDRGLEMPPLNISALSGKARGRTRWRRTAYPGSSDR